MLQIKNVNKEYIVGDLKQQALDNVSLNLRKNEFVAILGPSGSGKTTLLNIIGGLDRYTSGDLIINGISTKKYKDKDWDSYRNHTIGFVFQSYNLIPHQTILSNVELALTISGIKKSERKKRAIKALEEVGLKEHIHKKPNQLSGGQMQRVAIARALINNPDILLADEPTGALDSETSVQVMELLKEVAKDRLVVMVTHNPELAKKYATRIVTLKDGVITSDSDPYEKKEQDIIEYKNLGKSSMSYFTALSLSFNNLKTKALRTLLTSFAGSIGIIGIALILALSTGVNAYIDSIQKSTMASYPITIEAKSVDISSLIETNKESINASEATHKLDGVYLSGRELELASTMTTSIQKNNLTKFKEYLDNENSEIHNYVGENGIIYSYATNFDVYSFDPDGVLVNTDGTTLDENKAKTMENMSAMSEMNSMMSFSNFEELLPGREENTISQAVKDNYQLIHGNWPKNYNEIVLILDKNNEIPATTLYELGILPSKEYKELLKKIEAGEEVKVDNKKLEYSEITDKTLYLVPACDNYSKNSNGNYEKIAEEELEALVKKSQQLKIVGILRSNEANSNSIISSYVGYTRALTDYLIDYTNKSDIVKDQKASLNKNVLNGLQFSPSDDDAKISDAKIYLSNLKVSEKANMFKHIVSNVYANNQAALGNILNQSETALAGNLDNYLKNPDKETLLKIYDTYISTGTYDENLEEFGVVSKDAPSSISIYTDHFEDKDYVSNAISEYNKTALEEDKITYTDYVGLLMSSVTTIINVISYVLMAFVAVSLVVSSIMIGIITYISVLERTKEIGILRAVGASKRNISQVFNAETFIIGLCSGTIGIGISLLLLIPGNAIIHALTGSVDVNAILPINGAVILIILSVILTLIGGLIPAKKAAKKDPVTALRTE